MKKVKILSVLIIIVLMLSMIRLPLSFADETIEIKVDLSNLNYVENGIEKEFKKYTKEEFESFLEDYNAGNLPKVYVTEFLFDGVSMVKTYDLDDFIEKGNDTEVNLLKITVINVNTTGNIEFTGEITGGMIAVDTNERSGEINLILNNVKIDTDSKKAPAILVYNKDITYTGCKVTIKTASNSKNYIEGGKLKKVSLVGSDELANYTSKYSGESKTNYETYTKYYGIYTKEQINNILFAKVEADSEDLNDGDPYYFYKAAGAISSDIDLYFEGTGYLEVKSKNKEGVEIKGNLTLTGGTGDYVIYAEDDCLNTTTDSKTNKSARNTLNIDVKSLIAIVDSGEDADEGDSIDSNGTLIINGGLIIAIAHPGQDAGLDSENGTYINGGTILATGDMYDEISNESKQNFMVLNFQNAQTADTLITLLNENEEAVMAYKTDRSYTNLVYSSPNLKEGTYYLYKGGEINGTETNGFYTSIENYTKGVQQGYSQTGNQGGMQGGMPGNTPGQMPSGAPDAQQNKNQGNMPNEMPDVGQNENQRTMPNGMPEVGQNGNKINMQGINSAASNKEFKISGISNQFSRIADFTETSNNSEKEEDTTTANKDLPQTGVVSIVIVFAGLFIILALIFFKKNKKIKI